MTRLPERVRVLLLLAPALVVVGVFFVGGVTEGLLQSLGRQPFYSVPGLPAWSFAAYRTAFADPAVRAGVLLTLRVALLSTALATVLGVGLALVCRRVARRSMTALFTGTLAVPHLVGALAIALLLSPSGLLSRLAAAVGLIVDDRGFPVLTNDAFGWGIIAEYTWKESPFLAVIALAALTPRVAELEAVAATLGAGRVRRVLAVTLPMIAAPVAAGSVLVLAFAAASYEVPRLLGQPFPATLPVVAFQRFRDPDLASRPEALAIATLLALGILVLVAAYLALVSRLARRQL